MNLRWSLGIITVMCGFLSGCGISGGPSLILSAGRGPLDYFAWIGAKTSSATLPGWSLTGSNPNAQGSNPNMDGSYDNINGIAIDYNDGLMYLVDSNFNRIDKVNLVTGAPIGSIGLTTSSTGTCPASGVTSGWCTGGSFNSGSQDGAFTFSQ